MAEEARTLATRSKGDVKRAYIEIGQGWDRLGDEMEKSRRDSRPH